MAIECSNRLEIRSLAENSTLEDVLLWMVDVIRVISYLKLRRICQPQSQQPFHKWHGLLPKHTWSHKASIDVNNENVTTPAHPFPKVSVVPAAMHCPRCPSSDPCRQEINTVQLMGRLKVTPGWDGIIYLCMYPN